MKKTIITLSLILITSLLFAQTGTITNIDASQRTDGSMIVDIHYDLTGVETDYIISLEASFDGGTTYVPADSITGDAGEGIAPGTDKHLIWDFGTEFPDQHSEHTLVTITATNPYYWVCGDTLVDARDGQSYLTVQIGSQCWMAESLNIGNMINASQEMSDDGIIERYCYDDITANCDEYGALYQWDEMMQYNNVSGRQGICPDGWHLPTDTEWMILEEEAESTTGVDWNTIGWRGTDAGGNLKETGTTHWLSPNTGATNSSGFTGLPGGGRTTDGSFGDLTYQAYLWSSSENGTKAWHRYLYYDYAQVRRSNNNKAYGFSVRCILGDSAINLPPEVPENPSPEQGATGISSDTTLAWSCADPEGLPLTFNIYLGLDSDPPLFQTGVTDTLFNPGSLFYDTAYYWRVVAIDLDGDSTSGPVWSFTIESWECGHPIYDIRDGQLYETVEVGTQCWMAESLNIGTMTNGSNGQSDDGTIEKYCYDDNTANCDEYGGLYQWDEMMDYSTTPGRQGICPDRWHLPTDTEWMILEEEVESTTGVNWNTTGWRGTDAGGNLKETGTTHWQSPNTGATNSSGFTALGGGYRSHYVYFGNQKVNGQWWSSSEGASGEAWIRYLLYNSAQVRRVDFNKNNGFYVRCILGDSAINLPPEVPENPSPEQGATGISSDTTLLWSCADPEGLPLTYNLFLGFDSDPPLFQAGISDTLFSPGFLHYDSTYYWRIVAIDLEGDSTSGPVWNFTTAADPCGNPFTDIRDGQSYNTVVIGSQCWMAENLNIGTMINGSNGQSDDGIIEKYCYDDNTANCDEYGGLYQWDEMMDYSTTPGIQGICPDGWHLPDDLEYFFMEQNVDSTIAYNTTGYRGINGGGKLKEAGTTHWQDPNTGATNESSFTGLPGGYRSTAGSFTNLTVSAFFWSSSENGSDAWNRHLKYDNIQVARYSGSKAYGFSVRCVRDLEVSNTAPVIPADPSPADGAMDIGIDTTLSWWCADPNGDVLTYDIYFGTEIDPPLVQADHMNNHYDPGSLDYGNTYFWKIVAKDPSGNARVSPIWSFTTFTCSGSITDDRDGQIYNIVAIGTQCWMAENLNIGTMINATQGTSNNGIIEKYCYGNNPANCDEYGAQYRWHEMMQYNYTPGKQGICPDGWHLPTDTEWFMLEKYVDSTITYTTGWRGTDAGGKLKETGTSHWNPPNTGATNAYGFTGLPAGIRDQGEYHTDLGVTAYFWTSTEDTAWTSIAIGRQLTFDKSEAYRETTSKMHGYSVRCVFGDSVINLPPVSPNNPDPIDGANDIDPTTNLSWLSDDPEGAPLSYDIYFGYESNPQLVLTDHTYATFDPGNIYYDTTCYWKIVAHDVDGNTVEGPVWSFTTEVDPCGSPIIDQRDGQTYATVGIGSQCWMAENLNIGTMINGSNGQSDDGIIEKYCYDDNTANCDEYGGLYQWDEMMDYSTTPGIQGICPGGWHLPDDLEYFFMEQHVDSTIAYNTTDYRGVDGGGKLKEAGTTHWQDPNTGATNESGFTALAAGIRHENGNFASFPTHSLLWSSTESGPDAWHRVLVYNSAQIKRSPSSIDYGFSVRCVRDILTSNVSPLIPAEPYPADGASNISINTSLSWWCTDPNGEALTYDIYFGTESNPPLVQSDHPDLHFDPGTFEINTTYHWKIVAKNPAGNIRVSPVWSFQSQNIDYELFIKSYGGDEDDYVKRVQITNDGGLALFGRTLSYGAYAPVTDDMMFLKLDENGSFQWGKAYGYSGFEYSGGMCQLSDNSYVLVGRSTSGTGGTDRKKIDNNGNLIWEFLTTSGSNSYNDSKDVIVNSAGDIMLCNSTGNLPDFDAWISKINASTGNSIWGYVYYRDEKDEANAIVENSSGGYAVAGYTQNTPLGYNHVYFFTIDDQGALQNSLQMGGSLYDYAYDLVCDDDGNYVLAGFTSSYGAGGADFAAHKLDPNGNIIWSYAYGGTDSDIAKAIVETSDNGYAIIGKTESFNNGSDRYLWFIKVDNDGQFLWGVSIGGFANHSHVDGEDLKEDSNGCLYLTATIFSNNTNSRDFLLLKLSPDGQTCLGKNKEGNFVDINQLGGELKIQQIENVSQTMIEMDFIDKDLNISKIPEKVNEENYSGDDVTPFTPTTTIICD